MKMNKLKYFPRYNSHICRVSCHTPHTWDLNLKQFEFRYMCILYSTILYCSYNVALLRTLLVDVGCHRMAVIGQHLPYLSSDWLTQTRGRPAEFFTTDTSHKPVMFSPLFPAWLDWNIWDVHWPSVDWSVVSHHANKDSLGAQDCRDSQVFRRLIMWPLSSEQFKWR